MESPLSSNEREALTRFVAKLVDDVDNLTALFDQRGADGSHLRAAQNELRATLDSLKTVERLEFRLQARVPGVI
jgi:hypothetical protein